MKGIVLAGGHGTRLSPVTLAVSKQLLPIYDKPMIYYPLSTLMIAGIREILIITTPEDQSLYKNLLGHGEKFGLTIEYATQSEPDGLAQALILGEDFLKGEPCCLILGDNFFYGQGLRDFLVRGISNTEGATIYAYQVADPTAFGVVEFDEKQNAKSLVEKPLKPRSSYAVTGLYMYDGSASQRARNLQPSARGELEITDLNQSYLDDRLLKVEIFGRGLAWFDTGTFDNLMEASQFVQSIERRQGFKIACLEEIAFRQGWLSSDDLFIASEKISRGSYSKYLRLISENSR